MATQLISPGPGSGNVIREFREPKQYQIQVTNTATPKFKRASEYNAGEVPEYPDTTFQAYLRSGGNLLGIGYNGWRDAQIANYNTAWNLYKMWYESTPEQMKRITAAGLNPNLAYGMASPGGASGDAFTGSSTPSPGEVFAQGASMLSGLFGNIKTLAEAAQIIAALPESRFKGNLYKQLNVAAAASGINSENAWQASLNSARVSLGVGRSQAERENASNVFQAASDNAEKSLLDYVTSHSEDGSQSDFEGSLFTKSDVAGRSSKIYDYYKDKAEWDNLLSKPVYYEAALQKMINERWITAGQAYTIRHILQDPSMPSDAKYLALVDLGNLSGYGRIAYSIAKGLKDAWDDLKQGVKDRFKNPFKRKDKSDNSQ